MKKWDAGDWIGIILALAVFVILGSIAYKIIVSEDPDEDVLDVIKVLFGAVVGVLTAWVTRRKK